MPTTQGPFRCGQCFPGGRENRQGPGEAADWLKPRVERGAPANAPWRMSAAISQSIAFRRQSELGGAGHFYRHAGWPQSHCTRTLTQRSSCKTVALHVPSRRDEQLRRRHQIRFSIGFTDLLQRYDVLRSLAWLQQRHNAVLVIGINRRKWCLGR